MRVKAAARKTFRPKVNFRMPKKSSAAGQKKKSSGKPWPASKVSKAEQNYYHKEFKGYSFRIPAADETPGDARADELCIFNEFYKAGFTLPLPPYLITFCNEGKVLPGMLMPNTIAMLKGLFNFFVKWGIPWRLEHILSLLTLTEKNGIFYGQPKHSSEFKMIGIPSSRHGWKNRYFFVKGPEPWPITLGIPLPHIYSFKGWGNTPEIVALKDSYNKQPFCLHVETLAVTSFDPKEIKRKKKKRDRSSPAKKAKVTAGDSEAEAESDESPEEEEGSIQWSIYEEDSPAEQLPVETSKKKPGKKATKKVVQKQRVGMSTAAPTVQAAEVGEAEAVPVHTEATPEDSPVYKKEIGTAEDIPSPMRRMFQEESTRRPGKEPEGADSPVECYYNETDNTFYIKQNTKFRCIPNVDSSEIPFHVSSIFLHPEDENKLRSTSTRDLGHLQAQLSMGATQITKFLTERLQQTEKERRRLHKDNVSIAAHYEKLRATSQEQQKKIDTVEAQMAQARVDFEKTLADRNKELQQLKAQKEVVEEQLQNEKEESARKERINKRVVEGLKATAQRLSLQIGKIPKEDIIAEYKESAEYGSTLKEFSEHGYVLLKKYLERNQLLSKDQLNKIDYDDCIEEASDEESDNR